MLRFTFVLLALLGTITLGFAQAGSKNPAAAGFNSGGSDSLAIVIADQVMEAMGGRKAWDKTRYIRWTFFGRRTLLWDKKTGNVRIDVPDDNTVYLINIFDKTGKVQLNGQDISATDSLSKHVAAAESIWINDSYWLVMPYKLKDSGVTLQYQGEEKTEAGADAQVLQLTFESVGRTPQNRYLVYVDKDSKLVTQWAFFRSADMDKPNFVNPWNNYERKGGILLSGDRGRGKLTDIAVYKKVPKSAFESFAQPDLSQFK